MKKLITRAVGTYLNTLSIILPKKAGKQSFRIFCHPFRSPLKPHHKNFLNSSKKFSFFHKQIKIQGYRWGSGDKKILFLHGWQSHSFRWKKYVEQLPKDEYTIYAIDAPGHGASKGNILHVPMYSEIVQNFIYTHGSFDTVVGHSMGGFSALHAVHQNPELSVRKLVVLGAPGEGMDFVDFFQKALKLSDRTVNLTLDQFQSQIGKPLHYFSSSTFAASINKPGLIIHDKDDKEAPYENAVKITEIWKGAKLITTEGLKHNLKSPEVVAAVRDFIIEKEVGRKAKVA